ncbi:MAG: DUF2946 family protein [Burkholderiaceae bacterium]|nr:DUF2946 family protein [Burkholderiaceae bacterium]
MRRLTLALLFPLLLIAQQGAFVHSLEHLAGGTETRQSQTQTQKGAHPGDGQYCEKCFVFAQIGAAASSTAAPALVAAEVFEAIGFRLPIAPIAQVAVPRSRGPPFPL